MSTNQSPFNGCKLKKPQTLSIDEQCLTKLDKLNQLKLSNSISPFINPTSSSIDLRSPDQYESASRTSRLTSLFDYVFDPFRGDLLRRSNLPINQINDTADDCFNYSFRDANHTSIFNVPTNVTNLNNESHKLSNSGVQVFNEQVVDLFNSRQVLGRPTDQDVASTTKDERNDADHISGGGCTSGQSNSLSNEAADERRPVSKFEINANSTISDQANRAMLDGFKKPINSQISKIDKFYCSNDSLSGCGSTVNLNTASVLTGNEFTTTTTKSDLNATLDASKFNSGFSLPTVASSLSFDQSCLSIDRSCLASSLSARCSAADSSTNSHSTFAALQSAYIQSLSKAFNKLPTSNLSLFQSINHQNISQPSISHQSMSQQCMSPERQLSPVQYVQLANYIQLISKYLESFYTLVDKNKP